MKNKLNHLYEFNEYKQFTSITDDELMEMANVSSKTTGIDDVVIWIGQNLASYGKRIKVSNSPNKFRKDDCFTLTIPDFRIIGKVDDKFNTSKVLDKIILFVKLNMDVICDFSDEKILTDELIENLIALPK